MLSKDLIDILACPKCNGDVEVTKDKVICPKCQKYYPIKDDVPIMLVDRARDLEE
jgi:hypothetical protein